MSREEQLRAEGKAELLPLLAEKDQQLDEKDQQLDEKDQRLAENEKEIAELKAMLVGDAAQLQIEN